MAENTDISKTSLGKAIKRTDGIIEMVPGSTTRLGEFVNKISKAHVLNLLMQVCEDPGHPKNHYCGNYNAAFYAMGTLKDYELVYEDRKPYDKFPGIYPTEYGNSLYTGIWYAAGKGELVPKMWASNILVPFIFWPDEGDYIIRKNEDAYTFSDLETGKHITARDVHITPDGDIWFSMDGMDGRCMIDMDDVNTMDKETQWCLAEIVRNSKKAEAEKAEKGYDDLLRFDTEDE